MLRFLIDSIHYDYKKIVPFRENALKDNLILIGCITIIYCLVMLKHEYDKNKETWHKAYKQLLNSFKNDDQEEENQFSPKINK